MTSFDVLELLEKTASKNDKLTILCKYKTNELSDLLYAALSFECKFNIKKFNITPKATVAIDLHQPFLILLNNLQARNITGNEATRQVEAFLSQCTPQQAKWYARIIRKDLQAGFSDNTANKAGYKLPKFEVMLAKDGKNSTQCQTVIKSGGWVSPKLDGYRCIAIKEDQEVTLYSRNGKEYENFPSIIESIRQLPDKYLVLDGEIMSDDFQSMQKSAFASKRGTTVGDVHYHIFDIIPYTEWTTKQFTTIMSKRLITKNALSVLLNQYKIHNLQIVPHIYVDSLPAVLQYEVDFIKAGYEGAMFIPDCPYFCGRKSNKLMKFKTMQSMDCVITNIYEGINKYENMLGGLCLKQENGYTCDCGSGFTDEQRQEFYAQPELVIGRIVEIKYQELTADGVMRFPIFLRFRNDKL